MLLASGLVSLTQQGGNGVVPQKTKTVHTGELERDGIKFFMKVEPWQELFSDRKGYQRDLCVYALKFKSI